MSGASRSWLEFVEQQDAKEALEQFEQNLKLSNKNTESSGDAAAQDGSKLKE